MPVKGFRYPRLLKIKDLLLQTKALELRKRLDIRFEQSNILEKVRTIKHEHMLLSGVGDQPVLVRDFQMLSWHTGQLNADLRAQVVRLRAANAEVAAAQRLVTRSSQEKKTLELLKEKQDAEAQLAGDRELQKSIDEIAGRQYLQAVRGAEN